VTNNDKAYQLLVHGRWFSPGTPASSITKTGHHYIAEILLKVALNTKKSINQSNEMKIFENKLKTKRKQGYSNLPFSVSAMLGCR
jgi:hypothetical protein